MTKISSMLCSSSFDSGKENLKLKKGGSIVAVSTA